MERLIKALKTRLMWDYVRSQRGASAIEYALIAAVISVGILGSLAPVRDAIIATFGKISAALK